MGVGASTEIVHPEFYKKSGELFQSLEWSSLNQAIANTMMAFYSRSLPAKRWWEITVAVEGIQFTLEDYEKALRAMARKKVLRKREGRYEINY